MYELELVTSNKVSLDQLTNHNDYMIDIDLGDLKLERGFSLDEVKALLDTLSKLIAITQPRPLFKHILVGKLVYLSSINQFCMFGEILKLEQEKLLITKCLAIVYEGDLRNGQFVYDLTLRPLYAIRTVDFPTLQKAPEYFQELQISEPILLYKSNPKMIVFKNVKPKDYYSLEDDLDFGRPIGEKVLTDDFDVEVLGKTILKFYDGGE